MRRPGQKLAAALAVLGLLLVIAGLLSLDVLPNFLLRRMPAAERAAVDRSVYELTWVNRGLHLGAAGVALCAVAALIAVAPSLIGRARSS